MPKKLYIAGPMRGYPDFNYPAFHAAEDVLRQAGYDPVNPARFHGGDPHLDMHVYARTDIKALLEVDGICLLDGWEKSEGAVIEVAIARWLGLEGYRLTGLNGCGVLLTRMDLPLTVGPFLSEARKERESICQEADRLVSTDRQKDYGHPLDDFSRTAAMWNGLFADKLAGEFEAEDVARAMICVKLSRDMNRPKRDNRVDIAGYAKTLDLCQKEREIRASVHPQS